MVVLVKQTNGFTTGAEAVSDHFFIFPNRVNIQTTVEQIRYGCGNEICQIGIPDAQAFVGRQAAFHGHERFKEGLVRACIVQHMLHRKETEGWMHGNILVVCRANGTIKAITIANHGDLA